MPALGHSLARPRFASRLIAAALSLLILALLIVAPAAAAAEGQNSDAATTLALPISPGSIALLVEHPTDAGAQQRIKQALADTRPEVRIVAARVILDMAMRGLLPDVQAALAKEQDPTAGSEELRAWMTLEPTATTYATCVEAALRLGHPASETLVDTFARLNARELLDHLPKLTREPGLINAFMVVTAADRPARGKMATWFAKSPTLIDPLLDAMHKDGDHPAPELVVSLLRSENADLRLVGVWYVALCVAQDGSMLTPEVKAALDPLIDANPTQVTWEAFGLEMIARAEGRKPRERRWLDLAKERRPNAAFHDGDDALFLRLTNTELADYFEVYYRSHESRDEARLFRDRVSREVRAPKASSPDTPSWVTPNVGVRTVPPFAAGLWTDLLKLTGCPLLHTGFTVGADISYKPDGRPARISPGDAVIPEGCQRLARVAFSLIVADEARPRPATFSDVVVLYLQPEALACADRGVPLNVDDMRRRRGAPPNWSTYVPPKRTDHVHVRYTDEVRARRVEGDVIIQGLLTPEGCLSQGTVMKSPSPMLSGLALFNVLDWRFQPATVEGQATQAQMDLTVHFKLQ
jgi:TonB family protein